MSGFWWAGSGLSGLSGVSLNGRALTTANDTFTIAADANDGYWYQTDTVYPITTPDASSGGTGLNLTYAQRYKSGANYQVCNAFFRWDTSSLNDAAAVTQAQFRFYLSTKTVTEATSLLIDWHDYGAALTEADFSSTITGTAGTFALSGLSVGWNTVTLSNPSNVSLTSYTGLRLAFNEFTPTQPNDYLQIHTHENVSTNWAQLLVTSQY